MTESIFVRVQRVVTASVDTAVGTVERANSTGMMREAMRDADRAIGRLVAEQEAAEARGRNAQARAAALRRELETLSQQARFAIGKERADLAEVAVTRQVELEEQLVALDAARVQAVSDGERLDGVIADLRKRRQQMKEELVAFRSTESAAAAVEDVAMPIDLRMAKKVARAEEAFDRALEEAGGVSGRGAGRDSASVAEIAALQKQAMVAERMDALKRAASGKPGKPNRP
jgi:phage shock protein A